MYCSHCGSPIASDALFCENCGNRIQTRKLEDVDQHYCPCCGKMLQRGSTSCKYCGTTTNKADLRSSRAPHRKKRHRSTRRRFIIICSLALISLLALFLLIFSIPPENQYVFVDFSPIEYEVESVDIDNTNLSDNAQLFDKPTLGSILSVNAKKKTLVIASGSLNNAIVIGKQYILPPNASFPFGFAFKPSKIIHEDTTDIIYYQEIQPDEAFSELSFSGNMAIDMSQFKPAYDTGNSVSYDGGTVKMLSTHVSRYPNSSSTISIAEKTLSIDQEGYIKIDLGRIAGSSIKGELKLRLSNPKTQFDLKSRTLSVELNADYKFSGKSNVLGKFKNDFLLGSIPLGFGVNGLAGAFVNVYFKPDLNGSIQLSFDGDIAAQVGIQQGNPVATLDTTVDDAEIEMKVKGTLCVGICPEVRVFQTSVLHTGIYGGIGFSMNPQNLLKCYDINGYLVLYGEIGTEGWFTQQTQRKLKLEIYNENKNPLRSLKWHYEVENGFVDSCTYSAIPEATPIISEGVTPLSEEWMQAYATFLKTISFTSSIDQVSADVFSLLDMDKNGIPELIIADITDDYGGKASSMVFQESEWGDTVAQFSIYTYRDNKPELLMTYWNSHSNPFFQVYKNATIVSGNSGTGYIGYIFHSYDGDALVQKELATDWDAAESAGFPDQAFHYFGEIYDYNGFNSEYLPQITDSEYETLYSELFKNLSLPVFFDNTPEARETVLGSDESSLQENETDKWCRALASNYGLYLGETYSSICSEIGKPQKCYYIGEGEDAFIFSVNGRTVEIYFNNFHMPWEELFGDASDDYDCDGDTASNCISDDEKCTKIGLLGDVLQPGQIEFLPDSAITGACKSIDPDALGEPYNVYEFNYNGCHFIITANDEGFIEQDSWLTIN